MKIIQTDIPERGALLKVPKSLGSDPRFKDFKEVLKVSNPKYAAAQRYSRFGVYNIPKHLFFYSEDDKYFYLPRNYIKFGFKDVSTLGDAISGNLKIKLREEQKEVIREVLKYRKEFDFTDFLLNVGVGKGKTVMAIWLAHYYKRRTLVVVKTRKLGQQWIDRIKEFSTYTAGFYDKGLFDFTVVTYQYLSGAQSKGFDKLQTAEFYKPFGHLIFDEYHNVGAQKFYMITTQATSKFRTLLTATFRRKDGMTKIMKYDFQHKIVLKNNEKGIKVFPIEVNFTDINRENFFNFSKRPVGVSYLKSGEHVKLNQKHFVKILKRGQSVFLLFGDGRVLPFDKQKHKLYPTNGFSTVLFENWLAEHKKLHRIIAHKILELVKEGRNVLVLGSRLQFFYSLFDLLLGLTEVALITSKNNPKYKEILEILGMTDDEYVFFYSNRAKVILGIDMIAKEGLDIPRLDTLIFVTNYSDIEQPLGRIERQFDGKQEPLAFYYVYNVPGYSQIWYGTSKKKGAKQMFIELGCKLENAEKIFL